MLYGGHDEALGGQLAADGGVGGPVTAQPVGEDDDWELCVGGA